MLTDFFDCFDGTDVFALQVHAFDAVYDISTAVATFLLNLIQQFMKFGSFFVSHWNLPAKNKNQ